MTGRGGSSVPSGGRLAAVAGGASRRVARTGWAAPATTAARGDPPARVDVAVVLDLLDAACSAGASVPGALAAVGEAVGGERGADLVRAAARLPEGASWTGAWAGCDPALTPVAGALRPSWEDGVAPAGALRATAAHLRRERHADALAAANRLGVRLVLPLAACHLPAFVLVGLVPVLISVAGSAVR